MDGEKKVALELQPCCGKRSGIGVYTYELARKLESRDGLEFCGNLFNFLGRDDNTEALRGITMPVRENRLFMYGIYRRIWNKVNIPYYSLFPEADLNIFFNYIVPPKVKGKVITVIYDMTYMRFPKTMNESNLKRIKNGMRYSVDRSDHIITISEFSKREITELLGVEKERVSLVYTAPSLIGGCDDFNMAAFKFNIRKPYLLYIGTIEPRKNLQRLLGSFKRLKALHKIPHQLVLGGGKGWGNEEIYKAAEGMGDDVIFTGYLSNNEKNTLYKNADVFVFPSLYEGFGIPPLEAMAFGCPVVCSNAASLPEVTGGAAVMVDPYSEDDIAKGIFDVLSKPELREKLVAKGREQAGKFSWEASADQLVKICRSVLAEQSKQK